MRRISLVLAVVSLTLVAQLASAGVLLYMSFDNQAAGVKTSGSEFSLVAPEVDNLAPTTTTLTRFFYVANGVTDGPEIVTSPPGVTGTRQGGNCLVVQSGGKDEGVIAVMPSAVGVQSVTVEAVWFTDNLDPVGNMVGIQSVVGDEWPSAASAQIFLRTIGNSVPGRNGHAEFWTDRGDSNSERVVSINPLAVNTWYHMAMVFDYNLATPASSTLRFYIDGVLQGTSPYNATSSIYAWGGDLNAALFGGVPLPNPQRTFAIGLGNGQNANLGDHRGLSGGIDAIAISDQVLAPGSFVLPAGLTPSAGVSGGEWSIYE